MFEADLTVEFLYRYVDGHRVLAGIAEIQGETFLLVVDPDAKDQPEVEDRAEVMLRKPRGTVSVHGRTMKKREVLIVRLVHQAA